jgi:hypothetical protein
MHRNSVYIIAQLKPEVHFVACDEMDQAHGLGWSDAGQGAWIGFYDILRQEDGTPVGFRVWPFEGVLDYLQLKENEKLEFDPASIRVLFGEQSKWCEQVSADQEFDHISIIQKADGSLAFILRFSGLTTNELLLLKKAVEEAK